MSSTCHKFYVMHKQDQGYMINAQDCNCLTQLFVKACTHMASNLIAIDLRLDVQIVCDGLQQKFRHT